MLSLTWPLFIAAGVVGWGAGAARAARRWALAGTHPAEILMVGLAVVVAGCGVLTAAGIGQLGAVFVLAGIVVGVVPARSWWHEHRDDPALGRYLTIGAAIVVVLLLATTSYAGRADMMLWDDPNYLYLADRLRLQGNLTDPGNLRRIQSMGAVTALQAVFRVAQPAMLLRMADLWLGGLLILLVCGWRAPRRWSGPGLAVGAIVTMTYPMLGGMNFNSSPVLLPVGGFTVLLGQAVRVRMLPIDPRAQGVASLALGATGMALCAMRSYLAIPIMLIVAAAAVGAKAADGHRVLGWRQALWSIAGALVVGAGWAVAGIRDAGTPMYPLLSGNIDAAFPQSGVRILPITVGEWLSRVAGAVIRPPWLPLAAVGIWVIARCSPNDQMPSAGSASNPSAVSHARSSDGPHDGWLGDASAVRSAAIPTFAIAWVALVLWLGAFTVLFWNFGAPEGFLLTRYYQPLFLGATLTIVALLVRLGWFQNERAAVARLFALAIAIGLMVFGFGVGERVRFFASDLASGSVFRAEVDDPFTRVGSDYDAVREDLPPGARVFSAADVPHLLLDDRYSLETLDLVGFASRTPHLPFFTGDQAKLDWLRARGFDHLVAMKPGTSWSLYTATKFARVPPNPEFAGWDVPWATYRDDWSDFVERLPTLLPGKVSEHGRLLVVDLRPGAPIPEGAAGSGR